MFTPQVTAADTLALRQAETDRRFSDAELSTRQTLTLYYNQQMRLFWRNPLGLTPQQVSDQLGVKAGSAFQALGLLAQALALAWKASGKSDTDVAALLPSAPQAFTVNSDGTVTVTVPPAPVTPPSA